MFLYEKLYGRVRFTEVYIIIQWDPFETPEHGVHCDKILCNWIKVIDRPAPWDSVPNSEKLTEFANVLRWQQTVWKPFFTHSAHTVWGAF